MSHERTEEVRANLERAEESLAAARLLLEAQFYDSATSRAYYAAFYAAVAALLDEGERFKTHSGVLSSFHRVFVRSGRVDVRQGKALNYLFELRGISDYGETEHTTADVTRSAVQMAAEFITTIKALLP